MATFTEQGATMTEDEILQAFIDDAFPEDREDAKPEEKAESTDSTEDESEAPTDDLEDESEDEESESEGEEQGEAEDEKPWIPSSLKELAEAMEVEVDALKAIKIRTKVDGVEADVPLGEVIKNYQLNKAVTDRSEQLAHARKQFESSVQEFAQQRNMQLAQWQAWNNVLESRLKDQVGAIDWNQLREEDPAEYAAKRQEFTERIGEIERIKAQVAQQQQWQQMQALQAQHAAYAQAIEQNIQRLPELIPDFKDAAKMKSEMAELQGYLGELFTPEEVGSVYDARHILLARKAMLYDKLTKQGKPKLEQAKSKPKFLKPAARKSAAASARKSADKQIKRARDTQSVDDWAKVLEDFV